MIIGNAGTRQVFVNNAILDPRPSQSLHNHSPDGFSWGYAGSGPAQLALALLLHFAGQKFALKHYQKFKFEVLYHQDMDRDLRLDPKKVKQWIEVQEYKG